MLLPQRVLNASVPSRTVIAKLAAPAFSVVAVLVLAQALTGTLWAQEHEKMLGQRLVDEIAAKHKPELIYLGLHSQTPTSKKSKFLPPPTPERLGRNLRAQTCTSSKRAFR
jgi:hypothetical protein